ncbi:MAG: Na(+)/H(+) antiporter subunit D [Balneolaceae bacterium]
MTELLFFPAVVVIAGAFILPLLNQRLRPAAFMLFTLAALVIIWMLPETHSLQVSFTGYDLIPVQTDSLSKIFGTIFALIAVIGGIYAYHNKELGQQTSALVYGGSAIGVAFAGDFFTLIVFWELMAVSSTYLVWARRTETAHRSGMRYLLVHAFGGVILMSGVLMHLNETGSLLITAIPESFSLSSMLILLGIGINAAIPPLHAWLTDAYPNATITGAVFMCAFTTKAAVYVLLRIFPGWEILIWLGVIMALYGVIYAILANDIRVILAYSIISQIGYMVTAAGIGTEMALNGAAVHAFSHILYKSLLFMAAGAVIYSTGKSKLTELGGLAGRMKAVLFLYLIGALSISGFPFFNGFISKSVIIDAAGTSHYETAALLLILTSAGTFLYTGLKLPYFTWFDKQKSEITVRPLPKNMLVAMGAAAFFCTIFGIFPSLLYRHLPYPIEYDPYSVYHLVEVTQLMIFTFLAFWMFRKKLLPKSKIALDTDWFYRKPAPFFRKAFVSYTDNFFGRAENMVNSSVQMVTGKFVNPTEWLNPFSKTAPDARTYTPTLNVLMAFVLLAFVVLGIFTVL